MKKNTIAAGGLFAALATAFIQFHEGEKNYVYLDPVGIKTWCTGETNETLGKKIVVGKTYFTDEECGKILEKNLQKYNKPLEKLDYDLDDGAHLAFLDFTFNAGITRFESSSMMKRLKIGEVREACDAILKYKYAQGVDCSKSSKCSGVWKRRYNEWAVCTGKIGVSEFLISVGKLPKAAPDDL